MLNIGNKTFMNLQEAVGWLLENNALPFQSTADYVGGTEIAMSTLVNPSPAKVRVGSLIFFADSKVATVIGVTSNSFIVSSEYNDLVDDIVYVTNVEINASGHLICTLSNGDNIDAGLIKQVNNFSINGSQHLIASFNDGSSTDLGAIFSGNITISGNLSVTGNTTISGTLTVNTFELDQDITISNLPSGLTCYYAHARVSNGKLNIVLAFGNAAGDAVVGGTGVTIGELSLTDAILNKLYPYTSNLLYTEAKTLDTAAATPFASEGVTCIRITKYTGKIVFQMSQNTLTASTASSIV